MKLASYRTFIEHRLASQSRSNLRNFAAFVSLSSHTRRVALWFCRNVIQEVYRLALSLRRSRSSGSGCWTCRLPFAVIKFWSRRMPGARSSGG